MKKFLQFICFAFVLTIVSSCSTTKSKDEIKGFKKFYHNTTAKFNGFFNAEELMKESMVKLQDMHLDNYNEILDVYDYVNVDNPQSVSADLDKAIEKVSTVATIHDISNYVDDCYVIIGKAQYLKHDYVGAEETFQYFEEMFDPKNPYGRVYSKSKSKRTGRATPKELKQQRKEKENERKEQQKERDEQKKEREEIRKEQQKTRKEKEKERKKKAKERKKNAKKSRSSSRSSSRGSTRSSEKDSSQDKDEEIKAPTIDREKQREQEKALEALRKEKEEEEKRKKEEEKKKEAAFKSQGKGAIFKNRTAYTQGLYWLARTYIATERYSTAEYVIKKLDDMAGLSDDVERQLNAVKADLYIQRKEYNQALVALEDAINTEKDRKLKGRYAFIRAQIFEKSDNSSMAFGEYRRAKKLSPEYEMKFNAVLNELKLSYRTGQTSQKKAMNKLDKMLAESKNKDYYDQIYFTIAQIKLDGGDISGAIASFNEAIESTGGNQLVKLEAYFRLAELLFDQELYAEAKENYDMALKMMPLTDERYKKVEKLSKNLVEIAKNIDVIRLQDSLLRMSLLSEDELTEMARDILTQKEIEGIDKASEADEKRAKIITSNRQLSAGRSNFFAYNPLALNQGKTEFNRVWGDRLLEDNWRRSLRADAALAEFQEEEEAEEIRTDFSDEEIRDILRDIPRNEIQKKSANAKIQNALFALGKLFRERLRNYEKSVDVLERLIREYPSYDKRDEALFNLYLSYYDLNQMARVNEVKQKLLDEFPDSKFTKLATDPSYAKSLRDQENSIEEYYSETYRLFDNGEHELVISRSTEKIDLFPNNKEYNAKFDMLKAMSYGSTEGKEKYIEELEALVKRHPKTPEETRAKEILRFLRGDREAFDKILYEEALDIFEREDEKLHYVFIVVYDLSQRDFDRAKIDINNYNKKYHRFDNLKTSNIYLNQENKAQVILVRSFENKDESMTYYQGVQKNKKEYIKNEKIQFDMFASTQKNYREVIKQQGISNYRVFFEDNYLGR
ncbi:MAG: tetratricopeptide repeat protein [Saprospiraceae bacterium]|nr:tetratricopeptide repeat protein [Saprospiraceae bacterium]